jgi:hypothetical protein
VSDLLTIDVSSELATICEAQLKGTWQIPAEIVRLALRLGAEKVSVGRRGRGLHVSWNGPIIGGGVLADLCTALDADLGAEERQRAIAAIENARMERLLWAAGLRRARLRVVVSNGRSLWTFEQGLRGGGRMGRADAGSGARSGVSIQWRCRGLDRRRASRWLAIAARFAAARIVVDGVRTPTGFPGGLFNLRLEKPLPCLVGLTRSGDRPALWLLQDGVVSTRATVAGYPPFEAAVELGAIVEPGATAADMRRAVTPFLGELVDRAVWMMEKVSDRLPGMANEVRARISLLLLYAARKGLRAREISRIPVVMNAIGNRCLSVAEIGALAGRRGGRLAAMDPGEIPDPDLAEPESTLVASSEARNLLAELANVRFRAPYRRARSLPTRIRDQVRNAADHGRRWIRGLWARPAVPADDLRPEEKVVLTALGAALSPLEVTICKGRGGVGRTARRVVVPRFHPALQFAAELVPADDAWLYPLLLALDTGLPPPQDLRCRWLQAAEIESDLV